MAILFCWQFVLLFVLPAFGHVLPICIGQNILVNESIFFMPFILFFVRMLDIFHSITNEWAKFDTKDMFSKNLWEMFIQPKTYRKMRPLSCFALFVRLSLEQNSMATSKQRKSLTD